VLKSLASVDKVIYDPIILGLFYVGEKTMKDTDEVEAKSRSP